MLCANEAWAYAKMGYREQAEKMIGRAQDEFCRCDPATSASWAKFFTETDVHAMIATVHFALTLAPESSQPINRARHLRLAIPNFQKVVDEYSPDMTRSRVFNMSALAAAHLMDGDVNHGLRIGRQAVELAGEVKSARVVNRLTPLLTEAAKHKHNPDSRDIAERIRRIQDS